jgi:GNAT superfamily N-acetyltransferase
LDETRIRRLHPADAGRISDCFRRVYGESYANPDFYDTHRLAERMSGMTSGIASAKLCAVGAVAADGTIVAHMAMSRHPGATSAELGNTVVDPQARGKGIAWKVGAELVSWSRELGDRGFLDYPTTAHHIMQRQSIKTGSETGLMLGYIPIDTDGRVRAQGGRPNQKNLRTAATIVYHPYGLAEPADHYLPSYCSELVRSMAMACEIPRHWKHATGSTADSATDAHATVYDKRELRRLTIERVGSDMGTAPSRRSRKPTRPAARSIS